MIQGKGGIYAKVVADSTANGIRITTMELCYPRFIHAEFMTHRQFSRNASSSRAIPVERMLKQIRTNPAMPIHWGKNRPGMQATEECNEPVDAYHSTREETWMFAANEAADVAYQFERAGYHKQIVNRLTEAFQFIKVIVTATEWDNFFKLRLHPAAQPEIQELARVMREAMEASVPDKSIPGAWHLPYITSSELVIEGFDWATALKCSAARCARVSYLNHDSTTPDIQKDVELSDKLLAGGHMSPFEHQATPMVVRFDSDYPDWEKGVTHCTGNDGEKWSGNFRGFIQYRQLIGDVNV